MDHSENYLPGFYKACPQLLGQPRVFHGGIYGREDYFSGCLRIGWSPDCSHAYDLVGAKSWNVPVAKDDGCGDISVSTPDTGLFMGIHVVFEGRMCEIEKGMPWREIATRHSSLIDCFLSFARYAHRGHRSG